MTFDTVEDAKQKLYNTIILYKGDPVYVMDVRKSSPSTPIMLSILPIPITDLNNVTAVSIDNKNLDWKNLGERLGYVNYTWNNCTQAIYSTRIAVRKSVQGLCRSNVKLVQERMDPNPMVGFAGGSISYEHIIKSPSFRDTIIGRFPTIGEAIEIISRDHGVNSIAFNRHFSIKKLSVGPLFLDYKTKSVAWSQDNKTFILDSNKKFMTETLEHNNIAIA